MKKYIIALDQGTTSSRAVIFDHSQNIIAMCQREFTQIYPKEGWVEHDPLEIWSTQYSVFQEVLVKSGISMEEIAAIGITNQRETIVVWDRESGRPIYNAIVWQCRRTADYCEDLKKEGWSDYVRENTGLVLDPYFSGSKIKWILDHVEGAREKAERGELLLGTIDTWLVWNLTGKKVHVTDQTNASRTMFYNIKELRWDEKILDKFDIPRSMLPQVCDSSHVYGEVSGVPIAGIAGDQQAALFGQTAFDFGDVKNTYGTGCFLLMNTKDQFVSSKNGLLTTIGIGLNGKVDYALEGSVFVGGAVVQWLRDELKILDDSADTDYFASKAANSGGVFVVPAFVGLGAPYWDSYARGAILGITRGTNRNHIIRASLESIAFQTRDVLGAMMEDTGRDIRSMKVDGGACRNNFLMQFQADLLGKKVIRPRVTETTALGAACLAGLTVGFWKDLDEIRQAWTIDSEFAPCMGEEQRNKCYAGWKKAVSRVRDWERE
ncbi:MAG: glycerol kinase GlpK [Planctomycetia bacterium]|nr:glycerol kinase GlpK [Planctomycetia bacterium]